MRLRFGIRTALIATLLFATLFGWVAYHIQRGSSERIAATRLRNAGIFPLQSDYADSISVSSPFTFYSGTSRWSNEMSVLDSFTPAVRGVSQRIFGDDFHIRYCALIIYDRPSIELLEIESAIGLMPNLSTLYIDPSALKPDEIERLQTAFPNLQYQVRPTLVPTAYRKISSNGG